MPSFATYHAEDLGIVLFGSPFLRKLFIIWQKNLLSGRDLSPKKVVICIWHLLWIRHVVYFSKYSMSGYRFIAPPPPTAIPFLIHNPKNINWSDPPRWATCWRVSSPTRGSAAPSRSRTACWRSAPPPSGRDSSPRPAQHVFSYVPSQCTPVLHCVHTYCTLCKLGKGKLS